ncbi:hypothetical protein BJV82DRAFT_577912 [Fennellomyces sp. T-0311]|nr:hypothetical protein BJV82DRAFT_577912 [Fennellomyces sp. T-0311]
MTSFERHINPAEIREIWMGSQHPLSEADHTADELELERVIRTLRSWNCRRINRASFHMLCFAQNTCLQPFAEIARHSLTSLELLTIVAAENLHRALIYILSNFPQLSCLYLGTKCRTVAYFENSPIPPYINFDTRHNRVKNWDSVYALSNPPSFQHNNLASLHLESDAYYEPGCIEAAVFPRLPKLRSLTFTGDIYDPRPQVFENYQGFYTQLLRCCPLLEKFRYDHYMSKEYRYMYAPNTFGEFAEPSILYNYFTQQVGGLTRRFYFNSLCSTREQSEPIIAKHFGGVVSTCSSTLTEMNLVLLHYVFLDYAHRFTYPRLEKLRLFLDHPRSRLMMMDNPYYCLSPNDGWIELFKRTPGLFYLSLVGVIPREGAVDAVHAILPRLVSLKLDWKDHFRGNVTTEVINMRERRVNNT